MTDIQELSPAQGYYSSPSGKLGAAWPPFAHLYGYHYRGAYLSANLSSDWHLAYPSHLDGVLTAAHA